MNNDTHERSLLGKRTKSAEQEHLIKLYAIVANGKIIERHLVERKNKCVLENLVEHICKKVKGNSSTVVKSVQFEGYHVYYFEQDTFLFLLATQTAQRALRMQNYLRVVADIFYENYDEAKFNYVLEKIISEINRIETSCKSLVMEDQQDGLIEETFKENKRKLSEMLLRRDNQSKLAYVVSVVLFLFIAVLGIYYLNKKWT